MNFVVWKVWDTTGDGEGANIHEGYEEPSDAGINPSIQQAIDEANKNPGVSNETTTPTEPLKIVDYWNIALFGLDATKPNHLYKGSRSDSIMIASIHKETGEINQHDISPLSDFLLYYYISILKILQVDFAQYFMLFISFTKTI